jgi:hypothetical protein
MIVRKNPKAALMIGMAALVVASILQLVLRHAPGVADTLVSGTMGLMYGISIALLLIYVRRKTCP